MSRPDVRSETQSDVAEPLLPIEKKLIGWSIGIGLALLIALLLLNHLLPANL